MNKELEQLFKEHGKYWEKGNIKRLYLKGECLIDWYNNRYISKVTPSKKMLQAKIWMDVETGIADSDVGMIRVLL